MLSKILKGPGARQIPVMSFSAAIPAVSELKQTPGLVSSDRQRVVGEDQVVLLEKIRVLEGQRAAAEREAFEFGRQQGEQKARAEVAPMLERMNASIVEIIGMRPELRRRAEKDAVELSLQIGRRVLHRELNIDNSALNALARVVFDRLTRAESWRLTVHPQFADAIRGALPANSGVKVQIEADPSCAPGTFIMRCPEGTIDASVDSQLAEISRGLADRLARE